MTHRLRILHISDLHERVALDWMDAPRQRKVKVGSAPRRRVLDESNFHAVLDELRRTGPIDLVCFTGDIADWGLKEEYQQATATVERVIESCGIGKDRLFVVPGNHDVLRTAGEAEWQEMREVAAAQPVAFDKWLAGLDTLGEHPSWREAGRARSEHFWQWVRDGIGRPELDPQNNPHGTLGYRCLLDLPGFPFKVAVIGLDSTWLAGDNHDTGKLRLTRPQLDLLCRDDQDKPLCGFTLALVHHPLSDLADHHGAFDLLAPTVDLVLHGHQHEPMSWLTQNPDQSLRVFAAGSLYEGDEGDLWINAFQCIDVELDDSGAPLHYRVHFWAWSHRSGWHASGAIYREAPLGVLEIPVAGARSTEPALPTPADGRLQHVKSEWALQLEASSFWPVIEAASARLAERVRTIALRSERLVAQAQAQIADDRWRDAGMPARMARRVESLLGEHKGLLSPAEAALVLAVPCVYEAILALGALLLAQHGDPLDPLSDPEISGAARAWAAFRNDLTAESALAKRQRLLAHRGMVEAARDLGAWKMNRFLHASGELWEYVPHAADGAGGWINAGLDELFAPSADAAPAADARVDRVLDGRRMVQLARLLTADFREIEAGRKQEAYRLQDDERLGDPPGEWHLRETSLAHFLCLASAMAADPRRLDPVLTEHLGTLSELSAASLRRTFSEVAWYRQDNGLVMGLECGHEAIDLAAERLVEGLDMHCQQLVDHASIDAGLQVALPQRFTDQRLRASTDSHGRPLYRRPHLMLTLDQGRVLDLLMGTALYGNPELALRELYQNAMDACRLRQARVRYLRKSDPRIEEYTGQIVFRSGVEGHRAYVECEDNGIGMDERHLRSFFAMAGRRFTDSHEFHVEKAAWSEKGISFFPNSRFGVGVFSYFMIADELMIQTKRLSANGEDYEPSVRAQVVAGSNLFRIQQAPKEARGGTLVRLYLRDETRMRQLLPGMLEWLWLPEFDTTLEDPNGRPVPLKAGHATPGLLKRVSGAVPASFIRDHNGHPRLFWVPVDNASNDAKNMSWLLVDGILTANASHDFIPFSVLNLNAELRPELTVDRSKITSWSTGFAHIVEQLRQGAWRSLLDLPWLELEGLHRMFEAWPLPLVLIDRAWRSGGIGSSDSAGVAKRGVGSRSIRGPIALTHLGLSPILDALIFDGAAYRRRSRRNRAGRTAEERDPNRLTAALIESAHAVGMARWIAARCRAWQEAGGNLPPVLGLLGQYAAVKGWVDRPSLGLSLLAEDQDQRGRFEYSLDITQSLKAAQQWSLAPGEVAELARPLADIGVKLKNLDGLADAHPMSSRQLQLQESLFGWRQLRLGRGRNAAVLLCCAAEQGVAFADAAELSGALAMAGVPILDLRYLKEPLLLSEFQVKVLWASESNADRDSDELGSLGLADFLAIAARCGLALAGAIEQARPLQQLGVVLPEWGDLLHDSWQLILLSKDLDGLSPWVMSINAEHLVRFAVKFSKSLGEACERARKLAGLGIRIDAEIADSQFPEFFPDRRHLQFVDDDDRAARSGPTGSLAHLLAIASNESMSLEEVTALARPLRQVGVATELVPQAAWPLRPTEHQLMLLSRNLDGEYVDTRCVPVARCVAACVEWACPLGEVAEIARALAALGVLLPNLDELPPAWKPTDIQARLVSMRLDGAAPWADSVSFGHLLNARSQFKRSEAALLDGSRGLEALGVPFPDIEQVLSAQMPEALAWALSSDSDGRPPWVDQVDGRQLLNTCFKFSMPLGQGLELAAKYGVLSPELLTLNPAQMNFVPTQRHLELLKSRPHAIRYMRPGSEIPIGHLVSAAIEWALTLQDVFELASPLVQLGLHTLPAIPADRLKFAPAERHLILLSEDHDGQGPWIEKIDLRHLRAAADSLNWSISATIQAAEPLKQLGLSVPDFSELSEAKYRQFMQLVDSLLPDQRELCAWQVAQLALAQDGKVSDYGDLLQRLSGMGIEVSDAMDFVAYCASLKSGPAAGAVPAST